MRAIEKENPDLADVLPKSYHILESRTLASLLKTMASISMDNGSESEPDLRYLFNLIFDWSGATKTPPQGSPKGKRGVYQYFLGKFAMKEMKKGVQVFDHRPASRQPANPFGHSSLFFFKFPQ